MASRLMIELALALLCLSCQPGPGNLGAVTLPQPETKTIPNPQDAKMLTTDSTLGLPDDLKSVQPLWEVHQERTPNKPASTSRLYEDGRLYTWSNTRRVVVNGKLTREPAPYAWRLDAQLRPEGVERVQELIRSEFIKLPSDNSIPTGIDQGHIVWRSYLNGVEYTVVLPTSASADLPQVIRDINYTIQSNIIPGAVPQTQ